MNSVVLSHVQVRPIIEAREAGQHTATTSIDLGLTACEVRLGNDRVELPDGQWLDWDTLNEMAQSEAGCFLIEGNAAKKIQFYSEEWDRLYSLMPTESAPTMLISGLPMHRIKGTDPHRDTLTKIRAVAPIRGRVLDTATGLGYTAVEAAKTAGEVITIELDPAALKVARLNPWSQALFDNPKIRQIVGDTFEEVRAFEDGSFSCIIHDPPMFSLAGELYSEEFYRQLYRVLKRGGKAFHYIGDLDSPSGHRVAAGAMRRLQAASFTRITRRPEAFGLTACK
jgi:predicted methyltransferase